MQCYALTRDFPAPPPARATITVQEPSKLRDWGTAAGMAGSLAGERVWCAEYSGTRRVSPWLSIPRRRRA